MYHKFAKFLPGRMRRGCKDLLVYCGIGIDPDRFLGSVMLIGLGVALAVALNLATLFAYGTDTVLFAFIVSFLAFEIGVYMWLVFRADGKGRFVENILPDVMLLMSMNIRSGMTTDSALLMSAKPEFGPFEKELNKAGKEVFAGKEIKYALLEMTQRIKSKVFERTVRLLIEGIESGGELSNLLKQTAEELQGLRLMKNEVHANVLMYAIFIFFAAGIGAPLLFGISTYLVGTISQQFTALQVADLAQQPVSLGITVATDFLVTFAIISLIITSVFAGLIIGIIKNGEEKTGIKFIPILMIISLAVFFIVRIFVSTAFPITPFY